jgi:hypothetical protein
LDVFLTISLRIVVGRRDISVTNHAVPYSSGLVIRFSDSIFPDIRCTMHRYRSEGIYAPCTGFGWDSCLSRFVENDHLRMFPGNSQPWFGSEDAEDFLFYPLSSSSLRVVIIRTVRRINNISILFAFRITGIPKFLIPSEILIHFLIAQLVTGGTGLNGGPNLNSA